MKLEEQLMYHYNGRITNQVYNAGSKTSMLQRHQARMHATSLTLWSATLYTLRRMHSVSFGRYL